MAKTVKDLMATNEADALKLLKTRIDPLGLSAGAEDKLLQMFQQAFSEKYAASSDIVWSDLKPLADTEMFPYENLSDPSDPKSILDKLVVVKLNGGLGTTMGCTYPKSLIVCQNGQTFFEIAVDQLKEINAKFNTNVPLVLMHSFYTDDLMKPAVAKVQNLEVRTFKQNRFPRIYEETLEPVPSKPEDDNSMWNPPGHGDVFHCFRDSGLLDEYLAKGKKYMMISNIDNLGAIVDFKILNKLISENIPFCMETTVKTPEEWKGGLPLNYRGRLKLLECAQVPKEHMDDFIKFTYFNANNLWINLEVLKSSLQDRSLQLDVIKNRKVYQDKPIIQLEAASGSAISSFNNSIAVKVPRRRFMPVKTTGDLLCIRSNLYERVGAVLTLSSQRTINGLPSIKLSKEFQFVSDFEKRVPYQVGIINLERLEVEGDVTFGQNIVLEGKVTIKAAPGTKIAIPDGKLLKDVTITAQSQL
jgi:UTP--glucose-1-phosphate uridylyltransferase